MSSAPYMKLYFSDLAGDTLALSTEEFGAYVLLLGAMWNAGGPLDEDHRKLARIARVSPKRWSRVWESLQIFFTVEDGQVSHQRIQKERELILQIGQTRSRIGSSGGKAKSLKYNKSGVAKATVLPAQNSSNSHHIPDTKYKNNSLVEEKDWTGPKEIWREAVRLQGVPWTQLWLGRCAWDGERRTLLAQSELIKARVQRDVGPMLWDEKVRIEVVGQDEITVDPNVRMAHNPGSRG